MFRKNKITKFYFFTEAQLVAYTLANEPAKAAKLHKKIEESMKKYFQINEKLRNFCSFKELELQSIEVQIDWEIKKFLEAARDFSALTEKLTGTKITSLCDNNPIAVMQSWRDITTDYTVIHAVREAYDRQGYYAC